MLNLRTILKFIVLMSLGWPLEARQLEGLSPTYSKEKKASAEDNSLTKQALQQWTEVKKSVTTWWKQVAPKSNEQKAKEQRIQAEIERQKQEVEKLQSLKESLPDYQSQQIDGYKGYVDKTVNDLSQAQNILESSGSIAPDPTLPKTKEGVPYFLLEKIEKLPKLNVGREATVSHDQFMIKDYALGIDKYQQAQPLTSPAHISQQEIDKWTKKPIIVISEERKLERKAFGIRDVVTEDKIERLTISPKAVVEDFKTYKEFSKPELKMLAALILYQQGDKCHMVAGLFDDLSKVPSQVREANYHLGVCSVEMGFHSEAVKRLLPLIQSEDAEYAASAMEVLAKALPREYEIPFYEAIENLKSAALIKAAMRDKIKYLQAKGAYKKGHYNAAVEAALEVSKTSEFYPSAQFIVATSHYNRQRVQEAVNIYQNLVKSLAESQDENLKTLVHINLARIAFQTEKYTTALKYYQKIKKNHPLWVQGLIEQGWAQIMVGDYPGAIGNMYSLHSPYFKSVYMPESWAVRTIGYLNICQYGDAYNSLTKLERSYSRWHQQVDQYINRNKPAKNYYFTVVNYLKGDSQKDRNGLPYQVIRELARQRTYLNYQDSLNYKVDELAQYGFIREMINRDIRDMKWRINKAKQRIVELKVNIVKAKKDKNLARNLTDWNQQVSFELGLLKKLNFQLAAYHRGQRSFNRLNNYAKQRIDKEIYALRENAGKSLVTTLRDIRTGISQVLENNEFLRYEVYAGSGENIRFQVAGGKTTEKRVSASTPPPKSLNWEFDGEYWEDEIGSYRSTLKNNCPNAQRNAAYSGGQ